MKKSGTKGSDFRHLLDKGRKRGMKPLGGDLSFVLEGNGHKQKICFYKKNKKLCVTESETDTRYCMYRRG